MEYRPLGRSGLQVSLVGLGCNNFGGRMTLDQARPVMDAAIDLGVTFFDTADIYGNLQGNIGGSEIVMGELLRSRRDQVILATKFGYTNRDMGYGPVAGAKGGRAYIRIVTRQHVEMRPCPKRLLLRIGNMNPPAAPALAPILRRPIGKLHDRGRGQVLMLRGKFGGQLLL